MRISKNTYIDISSALLVCLFTYAALSKLSGYSMFKSQLERSPFLFHTAALLAGWIPIIELTISFLLVFTKTRLYGLYASVVLMIMFTEYISAMLRFSYYIPCSCGGVLSTMSWNQHLIFNIFFTLLAIVALILQLHSTTKQRPVPTDNIKPFIAEVAESTPH